MEITSKEKNVVLKSLCDDAVLESLQRFETSKYIALLGGDAVKLNSLLTYFAKIHMIDSLNFRKSCPTFDAIVGVDASDFVCRGGFTLQEDMLDKEVEKLLLEIESLKPTFGDKMEKLSTIAANISGIVGSFMGFIR